MRRKYCQLGRSMVEMLGVLAVIGLLSIMGLYGYRHAMNKHKANEMINEANKKAVIVAAQLAQGIETPNLDEFDDEEYEYSEDESDNGSLGTKGADLGVKVLPGKKFAIKIPNVDQGSCRALLTSLGDGSQIQYFIDEEGVEIDSCDKEPLESMWSVYNSDLTKEENTTKYSDSDTGNGSTHGKNVANDSDENATELDDSDEDSTCPRGQKWISGYCAFCKKFDNCGCRKLGKVANGQGYCMCADEGVLECDGNKALSCLDGYFLEGKKCYSCPNGYESCDNKGLVCKAPWVKDGTTCSCGGFMEGNTCYPCPIEGVKSCDINGLVCDETYYKHFDNKSQEYVCRLCLQDFYDTIPLQSNTSYVEQIDKCNATCGSGKFVRYDNTNGVSNMTGSCQALSSVQMIDSLTDNDLLHNYNYTGGSASNFNWSNMKNIFGEDSTAAEIRSKLHEIFDNSDYIIPNARSQIGTTAGTWFSAQSWCRAHNATLVSYDDYFNDNQKLGMAAQVIHGGYYTGNNGVLWANMSVTTSDFCASNYWPGFRATRWQCAGSHSPDNFLYFLCKKN